MFDLVPLIGRDPGPRICTHCWGLGVRWRDLDTVRLVGGNLHAQTYAHCALADDPPNNSHGAFAVAFAYHWERTGMKVANWLACRDVPPARQEGPRRV